MFVNEREEIEFFLSQEFKGEDIMNEQQAPYLGQRCHVEGKGFGTIVNLKFDYVLQKQIARVELDGHASQWYEVDKLELLGAPTFRAKSE